MTLPRETKFCTLCASDRPRTEFFTSKATPDGLAALCKACRRVRERERRQKNLRVERDRGYRQAISLHYNLTPEAYNALVDVQGGMCAICGALSTGARNGTREHLAVDHDHTSGQVRALLCQSCNQMLGNADDRVDVLQAAIWYLERHKP